MSDWYEQAACTGMPIEVFFPKEGLSYKRGKKVCAACPVADDCLAWALSFPAVLDQVGLFGGMSPRGRKDLREALARTPANRDLVVPDGLLRALERHTAGAGGNLERGFDR